MENHESHTAAAKGMGYLAASAALLAAVATGCGSDFGPFNVVDKLRVLGVQAEPPDLRQGESALLGALVFSPDNSPLEYRWSWCPVTKGREQGYECAVSEEELASQADAVLPGASAQIPPFDLGQNQEASFEYPLNPLILEAICQASVEEQPDEQLADIFGLLDCGDYLAVTIRLEVSKGSEKVTAIKEVRLALHDDTQSNSNPTLGDLSVSDGAAFQVLPEGEVFALAGGANHELRAEIPESAAEAFTPEPTEDNPEPAQRRENLFVTWFVTGGSTEFQRTGFFDGETPLSELGENSWKTPILSEQPDGQAKLFLVIQDERGGVGWTERAVSLTELGQ